MDYAESPKERQENLWRAKVEAADAHLSANPSIETRAAYLRALKTFADLVLRDEAPEEAVTAVKLKPR